MSNKSKTTLHDLPVSLILGVGFCSLLGYLIGLRILNWNPDLLSNVKSIIFLLIATSYLYAIIGLVAGLLIWIAIFLLSRIVKRGYHGKAFINPWVVAFLFTSGLLFIYLAATRQNLRSGNFDNLILLIYYLSTIFIGWLLCRALKPTHNPLQKNSHRLNLKWFFAIFVLYLSISLGYTIIATSASEDAAVFGNAEEIREALTNPDAQTRVAIFGWDGAEWSVVEELLSQGQLPNLQKLINEGVSAPFLSLPSTKSPLVWTSIATGKVPEKHGIQDFGSFQFPGMVNNFSEYPDGLGLYRLISRIMPQADLPVTSTTRRTEAIWNILSGANISVGLVGYWASWPAEKVNGFILSDRFTYTLFNPRSSALSLQAGQTFPPELLDEVSSFCRLPDSITNEERSRFMPNLHGQKAYPQNWDQNQYSDWNPLYQFELAYTASESFRHAGLYLYEKYKPSLFTVYFQGVDMVSHFFWQYYRPHEFISVPENDVKNYQNVIPEMYRYMDEILGDFLQNLAPGTDVLVISDHGFGFDLNPIIPFRTGEHRRHGIFIASGPHFQQGLRLDEISVLDATPTLLHLFRLPSARDMDGRVVTEALNPAFMELNPPKSITSYEMGRRASSITRSSADAQVREQIRALGYVN